MTLMNIYMNMNMDMNEGGLCQAPYLYIEQGIEKIPCVPNLWVKKKLMFSAERWDTKELNLCHQFVLMNTMTTMNTMNTMTTITVSFIPTHPSLNAKDPSQN